MRLHHLLACLTLTVLWPSASDAQQVQNPTAVQLAVSPQPAVKQPAEKPFTLNFDGGAVQDFVTVVEKATGEPFNVIIPTHAKDLQIPPVRVREVTISPLLSALSAASREQKPVLKQQNRQSVQGGFTSSGSVEYHNTGFNFSPTPGGGATTVWQLTVEKVTPAPEPPPAPAMPPMARFYQLKPNLEAGLKVEDITTVAQTAWKMMKLDAKDIPELKVHEETGILIAVGSENALAVIDSVLRELPKSGVPAPAPGRFLNPQSVPTTPRPANPPN